MFQFEDVLGALGEGFRRLVSDALDDGVDQEARRYHLQLAAVERPLYAVVLSRFGGVHRADTHVGEGFHDRLFHRVGDAGVVGDSDVVGLSRVRVLEGAAVVCLGDGIDQQLARDALHLFGGESAVQPVEIADGYGDIFFVDAQVVDAAGDTRATRVGLSGFKADLDAIDHRSALSFPSPIKESLHFHSLARRKRERVWSEGAMGEA